MLDALNYFDYIIIFIILTSVAFAFWKGFIETVLSLGRLILSLISSTIFAPLYTSILLNHINNEAVAEYGAFIIAFLISYIVLSFIKYTITSSLKEIQKGSVDRMFGSCFGLLRGILISVVIYISILSITGSLYIDRKLYNVKIDPQYEPKWIKNMILKPYLLESSRVIIMAMPDSLWQRLDKILVSKKNNTNISNDFSEIEISKIIDNITNKKMNDLINMINQSRSSPDRAAKLEEIRKRLNDTNYNKDFSYHEFKDIMKILDEAEFSPNIQEKTK